MVDRRGDIRLVDLEVIKRYSLAVRQEWAPAEEVLAALEASAERVRQDLGSAPAKRSATKRTAKKRTAKKVARKA